MQFFGEPWDAPICEETPHAPTPVGQLCFRCAEPIQDGDQGVLIPYAPSEGEPSMEPWHRLCFLREILPHCG